MLATTRLPPLSCAIHCKLPDMSLISVPVSFGELIDKLTILEIKSERIADPAKVANVRDERDLLNETWSANPASRKSSRPTTWRSHPRPTTTMTTTRKKIIPTTTVPHPLTPRLMKPTHPHLRALSISPGLFK